MALKQQHEDSTEKEMELETWPAFVDILSSTVVVLAFAFFILVVLLSLLKITAAESASNEENEGGGIATVESMVLSEKSAKHQHLSIVAPPTTPQNYDSEAKPAPTEDKKVILVPDNARVTDKEVKVTEVGESNREVLGEIPKFTDSRVMEVLKELVVVQQDTIAQQRKVIEQQDVQIKQTAREYQSLLALITKQQEVENIHQSIAPKPDQARFIPTEDKERLSGSEEESKGSSRYILNPPDVSLRSIQVNEIEGGGYRIVFNDNANYLTKPNIELLQQTISTHIEDYKTKGVVLIGKASDFSISGAEGKRAAVDRLILIQSLLVEMGVDKSLIKFRSYDNGSGDVQKEGEENYGWVEIVPNQ